MKLGKLNPQGAVEYDTWEKIYETTLTEAVSNVSITGLEGDTDEQYMLDVNVIDDTTIGDLILRFNSDSGSNYGYQELKGTNSTISASRSSGTSILVGNTATDDYVTNLNMIINAISGYVRTVLYSMGTNISGTTVTSLYSKGASWNNTANEITSMTISTTADNMNIGTVISLYRRIAL